MIRCNEEDKADKKSLFYGNDLIIDQVPNLRDTKPMIRCNDEGIPKLVQSISYSTSDLLHHFTLFDGSRISIQMDILPSETEIKPEDDEVMIDAERTLLNYRTSLFPGNIFGQTSPTAN